MPPSKQPLTVRQMLISEMSKLLKSRSKACIRKLPGAARTGLQAYLEQIQNMQHESNMYSELLTSLPIHISEEISVLVFRKIIDTISMYDGEYKSLRVASTYDEEQYNTVCRNIVRSVLCPSIRQYLTMEISSGFAQKLVFETLDSLDNLTSLVLDTEAETDHSALLASNIHHLRKLMIFKYKFHCSDEVVKQLGLHCHYLKRINITHSRAVTDLSVPYLMRLRKLSYVKIRGTSISTESYELLLTHLPEILNIHAQVEHLHVLDNIATDSLHTIIYYSGIIWSVNILTQKFPNLTSLSLNQINVDLSNLTVLTRLVVLMIEDSNYETCNLQAVFNGVGYRLIKLGLFQVQNVNISHIIMQCSSVENLILEFCSYIPLDQNTVFHPATPHFRSVTTLKIILPFGHIMYNQHLRYYVNVIKLYYSGMQIFSDDFIDTALQQGGLRNLEVLSVVELHQPQLTGRTIRRLLSDCANLKILGYLRYWDLLQDDMVHLQDTIKNENLDLKILI